MSSIAGQESVSCSLSRLDMPSSVWAVPAREARRHSPAQRRSPHSPFTRTHARTHLLAGCSLRNQGVKKEQEEEKGKSDISFPLRLVHPEYNISQFLPTLRLSVVVCSPPLSSRK